jgi:preprotein translocase SecF subunit
LEGVISVLKYRYIAIAISAVVFIVFLSVTISRGGFNMGVDFVGGVKLVAQFDRSISEHKIRKALSKYHPMIQQVGAPEKNQYIISTKLRSAGESSVKESEEISSELTKNFKNVNILSSENVGPAIGDLLKKSAIKLFLIALALMIVYLAYRFEFKYAAGILMALLHDVTLSFFFCGFANIEINVPVLAAILTIFGYSSNDTIVIYDRVRENLQIASKQTFNYIIDKSITQTLSRTFLTSLTVLFSVLVLYLYGGEEISDFALVMLFGLVSGTYSTIYIASPVMLAWEKIASKSRK